MWAKGVRDCRITFGGQREHSYSNGKTPRVRSGEQGYGKKDTKSGCGVTFTPSLPRVWIWLLSHPAKKNKETKNKNSTI